MADILYKGAQNADMKLIDMGDTTFANRVEAHPPLRLLTENGTSEYSRLKVTVGRSCFFAGRQRSTFYQYSIPTDETRVIKVVTAVNTLLQSFGATLNVAALRIDLVSGGTEGGTFGTELPVLPTNLMTTVGAYTSQVTLSTGGTHTGGTVLDILELNAGVPARQAIATSATENEPLGFAPGTYYIRLVNTDGDTATGVFKARWEERP
jgi:hypothetical protein